MKTGQYDKLMQKLGHSFHDVRLLEDALSHRSFGRNNNERLEFLGDSIVNFVVASLLYQRFPKATEGQLSRLRAHLVKEESLMELAKTFHVGDFLRLGPGEIKSGGAHRASILADAFEAIIGAIYMDAGMDVCYQCIERWHQEKLAHLSLESVNKDPKSLLQELLQAKQLPLPEYKLIKLKGEEHNQLFVVECKNALLGTPVLAEGGSRRKAEQQAAELVLRTLQHAL